MKILLLFIYLIDNYSIIFNFDNDEKWQMLRNVIHVVSLFIFLTLNLRFNLRLSRCNSYKDT